MKERAFLLVLALSLPLTNVRVYAEDQTAPSEETTLESDTNEVPIPEQPVIDETDPVASNELINNYNEQVDAYNEYVDEYNQQVDNMYNTAYAEYEQQVQAVEENNAIIDKIETQVEKDSQILDNVGEPTDWSAELSEEPKTIEVEEAEEKAGETVSVINVHVYLNEDVQYAPDELYNFVEEDSFELSDELVNSSALIEYETAEIDYNDTVTTSSEAEEFAGNIVILNGQRKWFGADPKPYFFRSLEGYTQGYWTPGGSIFMSNANKQESGWSAGGETYTAQYEEKETTQNYLYNGQLMSETITTRTTDRVEPKNIFSMFVYLFVRLFDEPERMDEPEAPVKGDYLEKLDRMDLIEIKDDPEPTPDPTSGTDPTPTPTPDPDPDPIPSGGDPQPLVIVPDIPIIIEPERIAEVIQPMIHNEPVIEIEDEDVPLTKEISINHTGPMVKLKGHWALINLLMAFGSFITAILMLITLLIGKTYEDEKDKEKGKHKLSKVLGILPAILGIMVFILTEDIRLPMALVDVWTLPMVLIFIISLVLARLTQNKKKSKEEEEA